MCPYRTQMYVTDEIQCLVILQANAHSLGQLTVSGLVTDPDRTWAVLHLVGINEQSLGIGWQSLMYEHVVGHNIDTANN